MDVPVEKICRVCGRDVRSLRRTKDPRGNYYCTPCYDDLLEMYHRRTAPQAAGAEQVPIGRAAPVAVPATGSAYPPSAPQTETSARCPATLARDGESQRRSFSIAQAFSLAAGALAGLRGSGRPEAENETVRVVARQHVRRGRRRTPGYALRLSDLVGDEAQAEVDAARDNPRLYEPEAPVSPITNLPVSALIGAAEYPSPQPFFAPSDDDETSRDAGSHTFADMAIPMPAAR